MKASPTENKQCQTKISDINDILEVNSLVNENVKSKVT